MQDLLFPIWRFTSAPGSKTCSRRPHGILALVATSPERVFPIRTPEFKVPPKLSLTRTTQKELWTPGPTPPLFKNPVRHENATSFWTGLVFPPSPSWRRWVRGGVGIGSWDHSTITVLWDLGLGLGCAGWIWRLYGPEDWKEKEVHPLGFPMVSRHS